MTEENSKSFSIAIKFFHIIIWIRNGLMLCSFYHFSNDNFELRSNCSKTCTVKFRRNAVIIYVGNFVISSDFHVKL